MTAHWPVPYFNLAVTALIKNRMRHANMPALPTMMQTSREGPFRKASNKTECSHTGR